MVVGGGVGGFDLFTTDQRRKQAGKRHKCCVSEKTGSFLERESKKTGRDGKLFSKEGR